MKIKFKEYNVPKWSSQVIKSIVEVVDDDVALIASPCERHSIKKIEWTRIWKNNEAT